MQFSMVMSEHGWKGMMKVANTSRRVHLRFEREILAFLCVPRVNEQENPFGNYGSECWQLRRPLTTAGAWHN